MVTLAFMFAAATASYNLPPRLLSALCYVESAHKTNVIHKDDGLGNSLGICQIKASTAKSLGYSGPDSDLMIPQLNIFFAAYYLKKQLDRYKGDIPKALAAYNAGSCRLNKKGQIKNRKYIHKVLEAWEQGK